MSERMCCICFEGLTAVEQCYRDANGIRWDVCADSAEDCAGQAGLR